MPTNVAESEMPRAFSVQQAVETIDRASAYDVALRRRTESVAWMIWGLVSASVLLFESVAGTEWPYSFWIIVAAWPAIGIVATSAAWRIAGLARPVLAPPAARTLWISLAAVAAFAVSTSAAWLIFAATGSWAGMAAVVAALPWAVLALVQWRRMSEEGRRLMIYVGAVMVVAVVAFASTSLANDDGLGRIGFTLIVAGIPFASGAARAFWT